MGIYALVGMHPFGRASLPAIELGNATRRDIVEYFVRVNFTGVAQSTDHRKH